MNFRKLAGKKSVRRMFTKKTNTLPKFNSSPLSNPWFEAYISLLGFGNFSANCSTLRGYVLAGLGWAISLNRSHRRLKVQGSWKSGVFFVFLGGQILTTRIDNTWKTHTPFMIVTSHTDSTRSRIQKNIGTISERPESRFCWSVFFQASYVYSMTICIRHIPRSLPDVLFPKNLEDHPMESVVRIR